MAVAAYDRYADWYEEYVTGAAAGFVARVRAMLAGLLGAGSGSPLLDVCCGNGVYAGVLRDLGWRPVGVDISAGQLRHARDRLPVARADATRLPVPDGAVPAVVCTLAHTDLPDYPAVLAEIARVLRPGGRFVHVGLHPCFVGAFADWSDRPRIAIGPGYADRSHRFESWSPHGVRARVGAWHLPLAGLLNAATSAGLRLERVVENGPGEVPDLLGLRATGPGWSGPPGGRLWSGRDRADVGGAGGARAGAGPGPLGV